MSISTTTGEPYRGRFAPSPTGPLHFGSLIAAVASFLQARNQSGEWLVRMEDLDLPRCIKGADKTILDTLEHYGLTWDGDVIYQSQRNAVYLEAMEQLESVNACYPCACSRKDIEQLTAEETNSDIYPGTCRNGLPTGKIARSIRARIESETIGFIDTLQGDVRQYLQTDVGDFVIKRGDGLFAYQLAVVVDDALQGITEIIRGSDLLESTPRQIWLQQKLGYSTPDYLHLPIAVDRADKKLSKQTYAPAISNDDPRPALLATLDFLGQQPAHDLADSRLDSLWQWAIQNWKPENIPAQRTLPSGQY